MKASNNNEQAVNVVAQILIAVLVPFGVFYVTYRVKKLRRYVLVFLGLIGISIVLSLLVPFPLSLVMVLVIAVVVTIYYVRKWSIEWNNKIVSAASSSSSLKKEDKDE